MKKYVPAIAFAMILASMCCQMFSPSGRLTEKRPFEFGELTGFTKTEVAAKELASGVLPADTEIRRAVYVSEGRTFVVTAVVSGSSRSSIHRPELCLPTQGFVMSSPSDGTIAGIDWRLMQISSDGTRGRFAYTFFNQDGFHTTSHTARIFRDVLDRSFLGRIDRWTMVTVSAPMITEMEFRAFLAGIGGAVK